MTLSAIAARIISIENLVNGVAREVAFWKGVVIVLGSLLILLILAILFVFYLAAQDPPTYQDTELRQEVKQLRQEFNQFKNQSKI